MINLEPTHKENTLDNTKKRRRHTRIQIDSLRPTRMNCKDSQCPKCAGYVRQEAGESLNQVVVRCLNCGWQPHFQTPIIQETEEARTCRMLTAQYVSQCDWYRMPVGF